jgi:hypothetical protein
MGEEGQQQQWQQWKKIREKWRNVGETEEQQQRDQNWRKQKRSGHAGVLHRQQGASS